MEVIKMDVFVIRAYIRAEDDWPCMIITYKSKSAAIKRAQKAKETFPRVEISINDPWRELK
jgi:hypothetical protein